MLLKQMLYALAVSTYSGLFDVLNNRNLQFLLSPYFVLTLVIFFIFLIHLPTKTFCFHLTTFKSSNTHYENLISIYRITVRATTNIKSGDELFSSYTYSLWPTIIRRSCLKETKYFDCNCPRCSDPTELGTHMGTLKCTKCDNGIIMSTDPLGKSYYQFENTKYD